MEEIRVLIIHPDRLAREALAFFVRSQQPKLKLVGSVADWGDIKPNRHQWALSPNVILLCPRSSTRDDPGEVQRIGKMYSEAKVLFLGSPRSKLETNVPTSIEADKTNGYFLEEASLENLFSNILAVAAEEALTSVATLGDSLAAGLEKRAWKREHHQTVDLVRLTRREREIITLLEKSLSNKEIAVSLHIEIQTVKNHVHSILEKLRVKGRRDVVRYARENGVSADIG